MSQTVARRIPIGPVQVYFNGVRLGTSKSRAMLDWRYTLVTGRTGDNVAQINARKADEEATIEVTIADMKISQLRYAMAQAKSLETVTSIMTTNYLSSVTQSLWRFKEVGPMSSATGTDSGISLPVVMISNSILVYSMDYETEYVQDTDFETMSECDGFSRKGTAIATGAYLNVHFQGNTTCGYVRGGGADDVQEGSLVLAGVDAAGKFFNFRAFRAKREGSFPLTINEKAEYPGQTLTFRLMADVTNYGKGSQLFEISLQA